MKTNSKIETVKLMHDTMLSMNNENAYGRWIYVMPDEPCEDDFEWFVDNPMEYGELVHTFTSILDMYLKDGLFKPSKDVVNFLHSIGRIFDILGGVC